jgi:hypothetical protein
MLGTEYSWLISTSEAEDGIPRVRLASTGPLTIAVAVFCFVCVTLGAEPAHRQLMNEAVAAAKAGDNPTVIAKLEAARAARPDYPRVLNNLSRYYLQAGRADDAVAVLREMAAMGLRVGLAGDKAFAALREHADFPALTQAFAANQAATGRDEAAWAITDMDGIIEGLAVHPTTLESFFSDVHNRCIWYRDVSGSHAVMKKFSTDTDGLLGVFALKIDAGRNTLWASSAALPEMKGYTEADKGRAFLAAYDLKTRRLRATYPLPADGRGHVLGDFIVAADGTIYASDSTAPVIWRLAPGATALEKWLESDNFVSLQGIAPADDGRQLYVSDYASGLWRIEVATRRPTLLPSPAHTTLFGIDGIYAVNGGLVAVQNGINPQRVIRISVGADGTPTAVKVLAAGHPSMSDLALGQVVNGHLGFIGNAGWALFEKAKPPLAPRTVTILRTPLE